MYAAFGSSVTQQKAGYVYYLHKKYSLPIMNFGYGSQHLSDAGICHISDVLKITPEYCFIDWFSTGYIEMTEITLEYLDTLVYCFTKKGCKLIFLFLQRKDTDIRLPFYNFVKEYLLRNNLYFIDLTEYIEYSPQLLRDTVHTTEYGSELYADIIYSQYMKHKETIQLPKDIRNTKYTSIKYITVNKTFTNFVLLNGSCTIVTFDLIIGPDSGIIQINDTQIQLWDRWCNYNRNNCKISNICITQQTTLTILQDTFDTSACTDTNVQFDKSKKQLHIKNIYYIGDKLCIEGGT
jgi:hypothetical protein